MTCPEDRVIAFLGGELSPEEEHWFDEHLLECEGCWQAVRADRVGRLAVEQLREPAPAGLRDRISLALSLEAPGAPPRAGRTSRRRMLAAAGLLLGVFVAGVGVTASLLRVHPVDPAQVSMVVAMAASTDHPSAALLSGERQVVDGQLMEIRAYMVHGKLAIVATSTEPLPMPTTSHLLAGSSLRAWMATDDSLSLYGVNRPAGKASMFIVAAMPMAAMPQVAVQLHLI